MLRRARFDDESTYLRQFAGAVDVVCPSCGGAAVVVGDQRYWTPARATVSCHSCGFSVRPPDTKWLGPATGRARKRCGLCGAWCDRTVPGPVHERSVRLTCSGCGFEFDEPVVWTPQPAGPHDPHVGLPLRHQRPFRGSMLWAYNREHLTFLLSFVQATDRRREPNANSTLVSRLPKWMKSAKNRPALAAALESMLAAATEPRRTPPTDGPTGSPAAG